LLCHESWWLVDLEFAERLHDCQRSARLIGLVPKPRLAQHVTASLSKIGDLGRGAFVLAWLRARRP